VLDRAVGLPGTVLAGGGGLESHAESLAPVSTYSVKPISSGDVSGAGITGRALQLSSRLVPQYPGTVLSGSAGTVEAWVRAEQAPGDVPSGILLAVGQNAPDWFVVAIGEGKLSFVFKNGRRPFRNPGEFYVSLSTSVANWERGEWHHLALVWANGGEGQGLLRIYVDGTLQEARRNCTLGSAIPCGRVLRLGYRDKPFQGDLDELRISNYPKTPEEIADACDRGRSGESLQLEDGTLLLLHFDGDLEGQARAAGSLDALQVRQAVERLEAESRQQE